MNERITRMSIVEQNLKEEIQSQRMSSDSAENISGLNRLDTKEPKAIGSDFSKYSSSDLQAIRLQKIASINALKHEVNLYETGRAEICRVNAELRDRLVFVEQQLAEAKQRDETRKAEQKRAQEERAQKLREIKAKKEALLAEFARLQAQRESALREMDDEEKQKKIEEEAKRKREEEQKRQEEEQRKAQEKLAKRRTSNAMLCRRL